MIWAGLAITIEAHFLVRLRCGCVCRLSIHQSEYYVSKGESRGVG